MVSLGWTDGQRPNPRRVRGGATSVPPINPTAGSAANLVTSSSSQRGSGMARVGFAGCWWAESFMCWADFVGCDFGGADLTGCDMRASLFRDCRFDGAILRGTDLRRSSFEGCSFVGADMAAAMADGVRTRLGATYGVATTGVAGPEPADGQPVGTAHIAVSAADDTVVRERRSNFQ